jgi:hypothetical protein
VSRVFGCLVCLSRFKGECSHSGTARRRSCASESVRAPSPTASSAAQRAATRDARRVLEYFVRAAPAQMWAECRRRCGYSQAYVAELYRTARISPGAEGQPLRRDVADTRLPCTSACTAAFPARRRFDARQLGMANARGLTMQSHRRYR